MNIAIALHMPLIADGGNGIIVFDNLSLLDLPNGVTLYVSEKWDEFLYECPLISNDYDLFPQLLELPVVEVSPTKKAFYIKLNPDVLAACNEKVRHIALQQLYAISRDEDAKRIYAGMDNKVDEFDLSYDKKIFSIINFNPNGNQSLKEMIDSYAPKLNQLKHIQKARLEGNKTVSPFSAYDRYNEEYAKMLLRRAYEEFPGEVGDKTYLYTYDTKFKTFVEFRPDRNNEYHGMDISREIACKKCMFIVKLYHK